MYWYFATVDYIKNLRKVDWIVLGSVLVVGFILGAIVF